MDAMRSDKRLPVSAEYLLMALDDEKGKLLADKSTVDFGIAAATLLDLVADGHLQIDPDDKPGKQKLRTVGSGPADETLADAWRQVDGRRFSSAVEALTGWTKFRNRAKDLRENELMRLVDAGILAEQEGKVLGLFSVDRYPSLDSAAERQIRGRVEEALRGGSDAAIDERTGSLIAILHATKMLPKAVPSMDKGEVKRRGKEISEGNWAGDEVRRAIDNMSAVMVAIVMSGNAAAFSS